MSAFETRSIWRSSNSCSSYCAFTQVDGWLRMRHGNTWISSRVADCNLRQGARHLTGTYKGNLFPYFLLVVYFVWISVSFVGSKLCFLSFSMQSHTESFRNFINKSVLDHIFFLRSNVFSKIFNFYFQTTLFDGKTVFFRFLVEIRLRTLIKSYQKASFRPQTCKFLTIWTLP